MEVITVGVLVNMTPLCGFIRGMSVLFLPCYVVYKCFEKDMGVRGGWMDRKVGEVVELFLSRLLLLLLLYETK